jgi:asparagine synthase (glutamine-hydrolysing)
MSVQFGRWSFAGESAAPEYIEKVSACIAPYGPDSTESYSAPGIRILYRGFHTTKESRREQQPHICPSGVVITWDGRLDNRDDLISELRSSVGCDDTDVTIVGAAFDKWDTDCFARLIGDWALSVWNPRHRSLILAKDPIGPRHLYYSFNDRQVTWCTVLDPLVLFPDKTLELCQEYIAGWLSLYPATYLTPYVSISAIAPASCVFLGPRKHIIAKYWAFDPGKKIRYVTDEEYEEHFRHVFFKAVQRRLASDAPVLAELSGGRDSSSIVCVADQIIARGEAQLPRLDTISYFDDSEPNWNERPYFTKVEAKRGRVGLHVAMRPYSWTECLAVESHPTARECMVPSRENSHLSSPEIRMRLSSQGNRVLLSGIGGDETMGGAPRPIPELQDLLVSVEFRRLAHQLKLWALQEKMPWFQLLWKAIRDFFPVSSRRIRTGLLPAPWLQPAFARRHRAPLTGYVSRTRLSNGSPSFQHHLAVLEGLTRQLSSKPLALQPQLETRYPYLDRDLLEFAFAIPRDQLVRPSERRSLMRRALSAIVPPEILNRKMKAFVSRAPLIGLSSNWSELVEMTESMITGSLEIVDTDQLLHTLKKGRSGQEIPTVTLIRTVRLDTWLGNLQRLGLLNSQCTSIHHAALQLGT